MIYIVHVVVHTLHKKTKGLCVRDSSLLIGVGHCLFRFENMLNLLFTTVQTYSRKGLQSIFSKLGHTFKIYAVFPSHRPLRSSFYVQLCLYLFICKLLVLLYDYDKKILQMLEITHAVY